MFGYLYLINNVYLFKETRNPLVLMNYVAGTYKIVDTICSDEQFENCLNTHKGVVVLDRSDSCTDTDVRTLYSLMAM